MCGVGWLQQLCSGVCPEGYRCRDRRPAREQSEVPGSHSTNPSANSMWSKQLPTGSLTRDTSPSDKTNSSTRKEVGLVEPQLPD